MSYNRLESLRESSRAVWAAMQENENLMAEWVLSGFYLTNLFSLINTMITTLKYEWIVI